MKRTSAGRVAQLREACGKLCVAIRRVEEHQHDRGRRLALAIAEAIAAAEVVEEEIHEAQA